MIDRFDVRALIDTVAELDGPPRAQRRALAAEAALGDPLTQDALAHTHTHAQLEAGRWASLRLLEYESSEPSVSRVEPSNAETLAEPVSPLAAVAAELQQVQPRVRVRYAVMPFPSGMPTPTLREHQLMEKTARRVARAPQLEVMLRMHQAQNPDFAFLSETGQYTNYFNHLKRRAMVDDADWPDPTLAEHIDEAQAPASQKAETQPKRGLVMYDSDEDVGSDAEGTSDDSASASPAACGSAPNGKQLQANGMLGITPLPHAPKPPDAMQQAMDKLLEYTRRNGRKFVDMITVREKENAKFSFLQPWSPFYAGFQAALKGCLPPSGESACVAAPPFPAETSVVIEAGDSDAKAMKEGAADVQEQAAPATTASASADVILPAKAGKRPRRLGFEYISEWIVEDAVRTHAVAAALTPANDPVLGEPSFDIDSDAAIDSDEGFQFWEEDAATSQGDGLGEQCAASAANSTTESTPTAAADAAATAADHDSRASDARDEDARMCGAEPPIPALSSGVDASGTMMSSEGRKRRRFDEPVSNSGAAAALDATVASLATDAVKWLADHGNAAVSQQPAVQRNPW